MEWDLPARWRKQLERRMNEFGAKLNGIMSYQSDRVADLVEMIAEADRKNFELQQRVDTLEKQLRETQKRQDKIADYVRENVDKKEKAG